ncbi:MAG: RluA family pseudouridine synthase [Patescibacteria group bacterium]
MKSIEILTTDPVRLDIALATALEISRAKAQKIIAAERVFVDGSKANAHVMVSSSSTVEIEDEVFDIAAPAKSLPPLSILYEDDNVIVVNKPAGLLVHPTISSTELTLVDSLRVHFPAIDTIGDDKKRSGIVHRLDKEASGVLIVAKTNVAFAHLKTQFADRRTQKQYRVLVMGSVLDDSGTITFPIARSKTHARMAARPQSQDGKEAITHFDVIERYANATLLDVRIETGRTHQIRAHFFALGHPVAGDKVYIKRGIKQLPLPRLFLHAQSLTLTLPGGEPMTFTAPFPDELDAVLKTLTVTTKKILPGIGTLS